MVDQNALSPRVSVIVPVRDRRALLRQLLDSLDSQSFRDFEVVVVDDGSTDGTPDEALADATAGRPVRLVRHGGVGAYAARMAGVEASSAPYLAFTDSDCTVEPGWLAAGVAALETGADVVSGLTRPARPARPFERTMGAGEEGLYPTCNVFYRRVAFERVGGFDLTASSRYRFRRGSVHAAMGFGEDALLAWRVLRSGRGTFAPDAVVHHAVLPPDRSDLVRRTWMMRAFPALIREVPELRGRLLRHGMVLNTPADRLPVYALLLAALFQWGVAVHDLEVDRIEAGEIELSDKRDILRAIWRKGRRQVLKDYALFPLLAGPGAPFTFTGNLSANLIRNLWSFMIIFCGHFPEGVAEFSEDEVENETRGGWYLRQMLGSANLTGSRLFHILSGNLSHQIEHHLFPDIPAHRYAEIAAEVQEICQRYGLPYNTGPLGKQFGSVVKKIFRLAVPDRRSGEVSRRESCDAPATVVGGDVAEPVVEPVGAVLPELEDDRREPEAAPVAGRRQRDPVVAG